MAKIRVRDINDDKILISIDNKNVDFYEKSKSSWSATSGKINFIYENNIKFTESPENFTEPSEKSVHDLIILLDGLTN